MQKKDKATMTGFERYRAVLDGKTADYLPRIPILMQFAAEYIGSDYAAFAADYHVLVEANLRCAQDFGMDQLSCISDPYRETHGFGAQITYVKDGPPRSTHPLESSKNLADLLKPDPEKSERMHDRLLAAEAYSKSFAQKYSILGWVEGPAAEAADLRGVVTFLMDLLADAVFAEELMDLCLEVGRDFALAQIKSGVDTIGIGDAIASQVSPEIYEKLIQPREKKLVQAIQEAGAWARLHICGNTTHLLPGIADLNVDILDVDHMVDILQVREAVGRDVVIAGNLDPVSVIKNSTPEIIEASVHKIYRDIGNPFMINAGCEIPSGTPVENLKALCREVDYQGI